MKQKLFVAAAIMIFCSLFAITPALAELNESDLGVEYASNVGLGNEDPRNIVVSIVQVILTFLAIVAVIIILIGGFKWMTAGGSEDKVAEARKMITAGVIGLAIVLGAFAIANFVINQLLEVTNAG